MQRIRSIGIYFLLVVLVLSACSNATNVKVPPANSEIATATNNELKQKDTGALITKVYTDLTNESGWWVVPKDVHNMTINVEAEHADTVLFWIVPTGTETWSERKLIGYDIDGRDGWSLTWEFGELTLHDHICVQALGSDSSTQANETINVHSL